MPGSPRLPPTHLHGPAGSATGTSTYVEDVGGGRQRELHPVDDEGEGGQVLDAVTVHNKLQREEQGPGCLISHLRYLWTVAAAPLVPGLSPQPAFGPEVATLRGSPVSVLLALLVWTPARGGGIWGDTSISPTPKTLLLPEFLLMTH